MVLFENTQQAYQLKSNSELKRSFWLFRLVSNQNLVRFSQKIIRFALWLKLPISPIFKPTVFKQFCAGEKQKDSINVINQLATFNIFSYLHYAVEGEEEEIEFDFNLKKTLECFELSKTNFSLPFVVFKPTAYGRLRLFEKISTGQKLSKNEQNEWGRTKDRFVQSAEKATETNINLLIDAEESWVQPAIDDLVEALMHRFNKEKPLVHTTLQMYRTDRLDYLNQLLIKANKNNFKIGIKLVRGAYIEKENNRAATLGIPSPICMSKAATDLNFDSALKRCLDEIHQLSLFIGTHNEASLYKALEIIKKKNIPKTHDNLWFSQLYGMSDHITFNLAKDGFKTVKYLPYGPVREVIPYLIRRAEENTSVAGQTGRELELIIKEQKRRKVNSA